jgi:hypothetical protein
MWWDRPESIKDWLNPWLEEFLCKLVYVENKVDIIKDHIEDKYTPQDIINLQDLISVYEKHLRKIESMMLEFKGCISMARSAIAERKQEVQKTTSHV